MNSPAGLVALTRPFNMLICFVSVLCGALSAGKPSAIIAGLTRDYQSFVNFNGWTILSAALSASLILASGNVFNDVCDIECDRINSPHRPLPSAKVTVRSAILFSVVLAFCGLVLSVPVGMWGVLVAVFSVLILYFYDRKMKRIPVVGNLAVAFLGGLAFVYGGLAAGNPGNAFIPGVFAGMFHLSRELIKDAQDYKGDMLAGIRTVATVYGVGFTAVTASIILAILSLLLIVPYPAKLFGEGYLFVVFAGVYPVIGYSLLLLRHPARDNLLKVSVVLKAGMPVGILALLTGFQGW